MFSTSSTAESPSVQNEKNNLRSIYYKFTSLLGRGTDNSARSNKEVMLSARETVPSDGSYSTPVSSMADLLTMSPTKVINHDENLNTTNDLLTGSNFDSICDITMNEAPTSDDMFIDATSLDYLVKCAESNCNRNVMDRGKESLFVKFDPLYAKHQQSSVASEQSPDSPECDVGYDTGSSASILTDSHIAPKYALSCGSIQSAGIRDKPMQVVPPVVSDLLSKTCVVQERPTRVLTRSASAILSPTQVATDRLISFSGNTPPVAAPRSPHYHNSAMHVDRVHSLRMISHKQDQEIMQLSQENKHLKSMLQDSEHKYQHRIDDLELKIKKLSYERDSLLERENKLLQQVNDKIMSNKQMSIVMEEYEKTISSLIEEQQSDKIKFQDTEQRLTNERDQALNHLSSMESSFNDLLSKYEKAKSVIVEYQNREKINKQKLTEYETGVKKYELLYNEIKKVTTEALNNANKTMENVSKNHNVEIMKLNATIKKHEITISSLQESLAQKTRDNEELTRICDQLINDVR